MCVWGAPVDGHHGEAAAAAAGERIRRHQLSRQSRQQTNAPSKEVCDQVHEFQQGDGVIPAQTDGTHPETNVQQILQMTVSHQSLYQDRCTHSEATKLHSEEDRGTYSAMREVEAKTWVRTLED